MEAQSDAVLRQRFPTFLSSLLAASNLSWLKTLAWQGLAAVLLKRNSRPGGIMHVLVALCLLQLPPQEPPVPSMELPPTVEAPAASRPQFEFDLGHGFGVGTMHAVAPGASTPIGAPTRFQNYGTVAGNAFELYLFVLDFNLRISEVFRVGLRASNVVPGLFDTMGELLARGSFEVPPGLAFRYDGPRLSVVPLLWLGTGYAVANEAAEPRWIWRPGWALDVSGAVEFRWKYALLAAEVGYRALWSWRQDAGADSESAPVRFSPPAFSDGLRVGFSVGVRFPHF
jgi:hypothetical protein